MHDLPHLLPRFVIALAVAGLVLGCIERLWPSIKGLTPLRAGWRTDLAYAFTSHFLVSGLRGLAILIVFAPLVPLIGQAGIAGLAGGFGPLARQPAWLQGIEMLVIADFTGYWTHRAFHGPRLWRFHAIHHSSEALDWLAAFRVHPVNDIVTGTIQAIVLVSLGFRHHVLAGVVPVLGLYALFIHANVSWRLGPLRWVIASPAFHRWHHTAAEEGRDKNFAGFLPVWDKLFGTSYLPATPPVRFGVREPIPPGFFRQLSWPFHRS